MKKRYITEHGSIYVEEDGKFFKEDKKQKTKLISLEKAGLDIVGSVPAKDRLISDGNIVSLVLDPRDNSIKNLTKEIEAGRRIVGLDRYNMNKYYRKSITGVYITEEGVSTLPSSVLDDNGKPKLKFANPYKLISSPVKFIEIIK